MKSSPKGDDSSDWAHFLITSSSRAHVHGCLMLLRRRMRRKGRDSPQQSGEASAEQQRDLAGGAARASSSLTVHGRSFRADTGRAASKTQPQSKDDKKRRNMLALKVAKQWKYVARERLARLRFAKVSGELWCRQCYCAWLEFRELQHEKWRNTLRADGHARYMRQSRAVLLLRGLAQMRRRLKGVGSADGRVGRALVRSVRKWRLWSARQRARRQRLLCLDGYAQSKQAARAFVRWHRTTPLWVASQAQLVSVAIHLWARMRRLLALRRWRRFVREGEEQEERGRHAWRREAGRRALGRLRDNVRRRRRGRGEGEWREREARLRKGLRRVREEASRGSRRRAVEGEEGLRRASMRRALRKWRRRRQRAVYWRRGAQEAGVLLCVVMRGRSGLRRWREWVREREGRREGEVQAGRSAEIGRVRGVWAVLSEGVRRRRREKGREKVRHARVLARHRCARRVWEGWAAYVGERRRKAEGRRLGQLYWIRRMMARWGGAVERARRETGRAMLAGLLHRQVLLLKGWGAWGHYVQGMGRRRTRAHRAALAFFRRRKAGAALVRWRRLLKPRVRVAWRRQGRLLRRVLTGLSAYWQGRVSKEQARHKAIHWHRARAKKGALRRWVGFTEGRRGEREREEEAEGWRRMRGLEKALAKARAWAGHRARSSVQGWRGHGAYVARRLRMWREWAATRAVRRGEGQRRVKEAEERSMRRALFRWRAQADARGMRRAIVQSRLAAALRGVGMRRAARCVRWWVEWGHKRALKRLKGLRARARAQAALARFVWRPWVAYVLARRGVRQLARQMARQRAERRARRGLRALWRAVQEGREEMRRHVAALRTWKLARERQGWRGLQAFLSLKRAKAERARAALEWNRRMLIRQGCVQWLETADWLRCQRVGPAARSHVRRTEHLWAVVHRCARQWRTFTRRRVLERESGRSLQAVRQRHREERVGHTLVSAAARRAWEASDAAARPLPRHPPLPMHRSEGGPQIAGQALRAPAAGTSDGLNLRQAPLPIPSSSQSAHPIGHTGQSGHSVSQGRWAMPRSLWDSELGGGSSSRLGYGQSLSRPALEALLPQSYPHPGPIGGMAGPTPASSSPSYWAQQQQQRHQEQGQRREGPSASVFSPSSTLTGDGGGGGTYPAVASAAPGSSAFHDAPASQPPPHAPFNEASAGRSSLLGGPFVSPPPSLSSPSSSAAARPLDARPLGLRPPPRRPVEMLLESSGLTVPHWIVSRLNDSKPLLPPEPAPQDSLTASGHLEGQATVDFDALHLQSDGTPAGGLGSPLVAEARREGQEEGQGDGEGGGAGAAAKGGREEEEEEEEGVEWWEESGIEAVEAQLRLWAAEKARFVQLRHDLVAAAASSSSPQGPTQQQDPGPSQDPAHRARRRLEKINKEYAEWRRKVGPQVRAATQRIQQLKMHASASFSLTAEAR